MKNGNAPTTERGTAVASPYNWTGMLPWSQFMDDAEKAPDLQWPRSIQWFDQMRNDAQCQGLYLGATAALRRYGWYIDPNGCDPFYTDLLAADMNLVVGEAAAREALSSGAKSASLRSSGRFSWYGHLAMALRAMYYGHFYFEQVGTITNDGPNGKETWRLRKLGPRHPRTITEIKVAEDGGLVSITQGYGKAGQPPPEIPVDRLVAYVWDQDPGNWVGRSIYRPMYRNWLVKDRLLRVDAIKHERNGVGMPIVEAPPGASRTDIQALDAMAQEYKAGERGGGAVPYQTKLRLVGTEGSIPDTLGSIRFHNEEMARSMLMMFMQLGQTETGSRALGQTFVDWFKEQQTYIADWVVTTTVEHVLEDWWNWNVDPLSDRTPRLGYVTDAQSAPVAGDFAGAQLPDDVSQAFKQQQDAPGPGAVPQPQARRRPPTTHRAAEPQDPLPDLPADPTTPEPGYPALRLPNRKLRRQPYPHEVRAQKDFEDEDADKDSTEKEVEELWAAEETAIVDKIADAVEENEEIVDIVEVIAETGTEIATAAFPKGTLPPVPPKKVANLAEHAIQAALARLALRAQSSAIASLSRQGFVRATTMTLRFLPNLAALALYGITGSVYGLSGYGLYRVAARGLRAMRDAVTQVAESIATTVQGAMTDTRQLAQHLRDTMSGGKAPIGGGRDNVRGMINTTYNNEQIGVYDVAMQDGADLDLYASELLDRNTCPACLYIDGQTLTVAQAKALYAGGGYLECDGGPRCRGTVVAVYKGERSIT
jgi:hypothetical protein